MGKWTNRSRLFLINADTIKVVNGDKLMLVESKGIAKTERADTTETSFINQLKKTGEMAGTSRVDAYTEYLRSKYGNVRIQNVGKDQQSLDRIGKSMSGGDVVIAPNILEQNWQMDIAYQKKSMAEFFANRAVDISRITYTASTENLGSAIAAYEKNIMEVAGSLNR